MQNVEIGLEGIFIYSFLLVGENYQAIIQMKGAIVIQITGFRFVL